MAQQNKITATTRKNISDELKVSRLWYNGQLEEPNFLDRLYDLKQLPSRDHRYTNAYDDIYQHMVMNNDWDEGWVFTDTRFNLMHTSDEEYLSFLAETLHPAVRTDKKEISQMQEIYNHHFLDDCYKFPAFAKFLSYQFLLQGVVFLQENSNILHQMYASD